MIHRLLQLLFPEKCIFCRKILTENETDLCHSCRQSAPAFSKGNFKISFIARWTGLWYYKDNVRQSILRYKFSGRRSYAPAYGRMLAMRLMNTGFDDFDVLTWVPISARRRWKRGYDQVELLCGCVAKELNVPTVKTLRKIRHTPPQSVIREEAKRKANVLGAYQVTDPVLIAGKRVLLLDDILTTGATASECARTLLTAGASEVTYAALAIAAYKK